MLLETSERIRLEDLFVRMLRLVTRNRFIKYDADDELKRDGYTHHVHAVPLIGKPTIPKNLTRENTIR